MKKIFAAIILSMCLTSTACSNGWNRQIFDTTYHFDRAIISLPDGTIVEGKVQSWTDYEDGDQLQIKIDGVTYLVHSSDAVLIAEGQK